jgi:hypothetical protein
VLATAPYIISDNPNEIIKLVNNTSNYGGAFTIFKIRGKVRSFITSHARHEGTRLKRVNEATMAEYLNTLGALHDILTSKHKSTNLTYFMAAANDGSIISFRLEKDSEITIALDGENMYHYVKVPGIRRALISRSFGAFITTMPEDHEYPVNAMNEDNIMELLNYVTKSSKTLMAIVPFDDPVRDIINDITKTINEELMMVMPEEMTHELATLTTLNAVMKSGEALPSFSLVIMSGSDGGVISILLGGYGLLIHVGIDSRNIYYVYESGSDKYALMSKVMNLYIPYTTST